MQKKFSIREKRPDLRRREIVILGSLGGFLAGAYSFPIENLLNIADEKEVYRIFWTILTSMIAGAVWSYVHIPEQNRIRAFQMGILAPSVMAALIYAQYPSQSIARSNERSSGSIVQNNLTNFKASQPWGKDSLAKTVAYESVLKQNDFPKTRVHRDGIDKPRDDRIKKPKRKSWWELIFG